MNKIILSITLILFSCTSKPVLPEKSDIIVSRSEAPLGCENLGAIEGRSNKQNATPEEALEDLKGEAIKKGANFVKIETMGALSSSIRGSAFYCR